MGCPDPVEVSSVVSYDIAKALTDGQADVEDFVGGSVRFSDGSVILIENAWAAHVREEIFEVRILGTEGGAQTHPQVDIILKDRDVPSVDEEQFETQFEHFISCIRENKTPDTDVTGGIKVLEMLDAMYESGETGQAVKLEGWQ
jgi:predicted dehydrogenase